MKLTLKDQKILGQLEFNSRATLNDIAQKVGLSKQVVNYRMKNLIKTKTITQFYTIVNFSKLGYTQYKLYLKFQNVTLEKEQEIINYWVKINNSVWVASCRGNWDLAVSILSKNINELGEVLNAFFNKYGWFILEKDALITQHSQVFTRAGLKIDKKKFTYGNKIENYFLDGIDTKIIKALSNNARLTILELMEKLNLTRDVITYRIKKLAQEQIICQYRLTVDLGFKLYKILLRLHSLTPEKEKQLVTYLAFHQKGKQYLKLVGSWDAELEFEVENDEQLHNILLELRSQFSDIIRDYNLLLINKEYKLNYFPF